MKHIKDFLMTYIWSIAIILAFIGALAYFGVFSPRYTKGCFVDGFECSGYDIKADSADITLRNKEKPILIKEIWLNECKKEYSEGLMVDKDAFLRETLACNFSQGEFKGTLKIRYVDKGSELETIEGNIISFIY
jgi:hypothetical protein